MLAAWNDTYGPVEQVQLRDLPVPKPGKGQVLLKVAACGVNASDVELTTAHPAYARAYGLFRPRVKTLGSDIAGFVEETGPDVSGMKPGTRVVCDAFDSFGGFAEYAVVPAARLVPMPDGMDFVTAAALPQAAVIALQGVRKVCSGEKVLINGAGGGMGSFAVQLAKAKGGEVTAVDSAAKGDLLQKLGADRVLDYREVDFAAEGIGYDLILDLFGTRKNREIRPCLNEAGRYLFVGGSVAAWGSVMTTGTLFSFGSRKYRLLVAKQDVDDLREVVSSVAEGRLSVAVDRVFALQDVAKALAHVANGLALGKVVVKVLPD